MATFGRGHSARAVFVHRKKLAALGEEPSIIDARAESITAIQLLNRDGHDCYLCHLPLEPDFQIEHIIPRVHGGTDHLANLALACRSCNARKKDRIVSIRVKDRIPCYWIGT